jgi:hypothetical protein
VLSWSRERLPLPLSYLKEKPLLNALNEALKLTERVEENLKEALKTLARALVGDQEAARKVESFGAKEFYWSRMETPFKKFLLDLATDLQIEGEEKYYGKEVLPQWANTTIKIARNAMEYVINNLSASAHELLAAAQAESEFARQLGKTRKTCANFFPLETSAIGGRL